MVTPTQIEGYLQDKLNCEYLTVEGDGAHFQAVIVSSAFDGKSRVARHQVVYGALGDRMREEIHALSMKTLTPAEWHAQSSAPASSH
ncbi:MAG: BolA family transcriptional regulator [Aeromicrobium sp.]|nr:BolA family transcriptional regulator [Burkholderiales bacterium]